MVEDLRSARNSHRVLVSFKMQQYTICFILLSFLLFANAKMMKVYYEKEHRPTYYKQGHSSRNHVDYRRTKVAHGDRYYKYVK